MLIKWSTTKYQERFSKIMKCLETQVQVIKERYVIIPDNYEDFIIDKELLKGLTKPFYQYRSNCTIMLRSEYEYELEKERQRRLKQEKKRMEEQRILREKEEVIECLRQEYGNKWRDRNWINKNVGEYTECYWDPMFEYFWTLIEDNWQRVDWKQNIKLEQGIYNRIEGIKVNGVSGKSFLNAKFKNNKGYNASILKECFKTMHNMDEDRDYGVYAIRTDEEIIYVGSTFRDFNIRIKEHVAAVKSGSKELAVYDIIRELKKEGKDVYVEILVNCKDIETNKKLTIDDIQSMELGFINYFKPKGNVSGIKIPFRYRGY